jgi:hypothetical protein
VSFENLKKEIKPNHQLHDSWNCNPETFHYINFKIVPGKAISRKRKTLVGRIKNIPLKYKHIHLFWALSPLK